MKTRYTILKCKSVLKKSSKKKLFCLQDPFGKGLAIYTFENKCNELSELALEDGAKKIFKCIRTPSGYTCHLMPKNASGDLTKVTPELASFLMYLKDGNPTDKFTKAIDSEIENNIQHESWRNEYMIFEQHFSKLKTILSILHACERSEYEM